jgi:hypothetical protein
VSAPSSLARAVGALVTTVLAAAGAEAGTKVRHKLVVPPTWSVPTVAVDIGTVTHMKATPGGLVLAGQSGVASVDAAGVVRWSTPLPWAMVRMVDADADGVSFTAWTLAGLEDKGKALNAWASGQLLDRFQVEGAVVGHLSADGTPTWQVDALDALPLAPPGATGGVVGVNTGKHVVVYSRADGSVVGSSELVGANLQGGMFKGVYDHATRGEVVPLGGSLYTSFFSHFYKVGLDGAIVEKEAAAGLTPYVDITCGPVELGELVVFGTTGDANIRSNLFAMRDDMKNKWKTASPDEQSGCGDMVRDGDLVYASSNFTVFALNEKGKLEWESVNKKGGLYPSANRGIRYIGNIGARKTYGDLLAVGGGKVFVATDNGHDTITVLDAADGSYVHTLDVAETLVSLATLDGKLAVATTSGLHLMDL